MAKIPSFNIKLPTSAHSRFLMRVCVFAIAVVLERRSIARGSHRGVRRVDARTGADLSLRQTVVVLGARARRTFAVDALAPPRMRAEEILVEVGPMR